MNSLIDKVLDADGILAYVNVFLLLIAGAFGLPIPEDLCLLAAGVLIHSQNVNLYLMGAVAYIGVLVGDILLFRAGRLAGPAILRRKWVRRHISSSRLREIRLNLETQSLITIFLARHIFYLRTVTFLLCGAVRMSFVRFIIADAIAALITVPLFTFLGYLGAQHFDYIIGWIDRAKYALLVVGIVGASLGIKYYYFRKPKNEPEDGSNPLESKCR